MCAEEIKATLIDLVFYALIIFQIEVRFGGMRRARVSAFENTAVLKIV